MAKKRNPPPPVGDARPDPRKSYPSITSFLLDQRERDRSRSKELDPAIARLSPFFSTEASKRRAAGRAEVQRLVLASPPPKLSNEDRYALALSWVASTGTLPRYASLDDDHVRDLEAMASKIATYAKEPTLKRPLNFLLMAPPGSGKSHLIDCVSESLKAERVAGHAFNMATMTAPDDLGTPLDEARNLKVDDRIPLLFLDEFDAAPENYGLLLPLLWDGKIGLRHRTITLGKSVVVMAGSSKLLPTALNEARSMRSGASALEGPNAKLVDLISRINGAVVAIPPLDGANGIPGRPFDKVVIAVELLKRRFPAVRRVSLALLAFIGRARFRYDVRSINCVIDLIDAPPAGAPTELRLDQMPEELSSVQGIRESSLVYHLVDDEGIAGIVNLWRELKEHDTLVPLTAPATPATAKDEERRMAIAYALRVIDNQP